MKDCKHCHQRPSVLDGLCKLCFNLLLIIPLRKQIEQAQAIIKTCESNRLALARRLFEAEQLTLRIERTEARLADEKPYSCRCKTHFQYERDYVEHARSCTGELFETKSVQAIRASRVRRSEALKEISI
jgi:hypothetical protein